jgi:hypothetical protein
VTLTEAHHLLDEVRAGSQQHGLEAVTEALWLTGDIGPVMRRRYGETLPSQVPPADPPPEPWQPGFMTNR